ncbi:Bax inhibitor-1/YccA family protein [Candidatus Clavichlamydia salmonicola]|uniref:Bax inhibitor-1/YccA family protein n=1 Tax=Candidatus Clavichlamydia salmonicola TaxID=469812 RepID=UPI001890BC0D|nr:Bax inhibitor-1/YccA family protein [Candidatus Clavichlamydia salmonicola]
MSYSRETVRDVKALSVFSSRVYGWMTLGLSVTAFVAYTLGASGLSMALQPFWWVCTLGTLGISFWINRRISTMSLGGVASLFVLYAVLEGVIFGLVLPMFAKAYGGGIIWTAFLTAAVIFGMSALYGTFTKSDLTGLGKILSMAFVGFIVISLLFFVISMFVHLPFFYLMISYIGLVLFTALTAYDAHTIRRMSQEVSVESVVSYKLSLMMALRMYLNMIMIFWYLLQIFSSSNNNRK